MTKRRKRYRNFKRRILTACFLPGVADHVTIFLINSLPQSRDSNRLGTAEVALHDSQCRYAFPGYTASLDAEGN